MAGRIKKMLTLIKNKRGLFVIEKFNDESGVFASCNPLTAWGDTFNTRDETCSSSQYLPKHHPDLTIACSYAWLYLN